MQHSRNDCNQSCSCDAMERRKRTINNDANNGDKDEEEEDDSDNNNGANMEEEFTEGFDHDLEDSCSTVVLAIPQERWDPLGADSTVEVSDCCFQELQQLHHQYEPSNHGQTAGGASSGIGLNRIRNLEEEQEILTTSLMALTSHFAQVQFRLRQICDTPPQGRDGLLKDLEEFAFRGIPEITAKLHPTESDEVNCSLERAKQRQFELIDRLKTELTELEKFAYASGTPGVLPQSILLEKQKIIIEELKAKLNLQVNEIDLPQLTSEEIRNHVETALGKFVGPLKMKDQLVGQLKTQITDLERFIAFLQYSSDAPAISNNEKEGEQLKSIAANIYGNSKANDVYNSYSAKKNYFDSGGRVKITSPADTETKRKKSSTIPEKGSSLNTKAHSLIDKASTMLQMFAVTQFGCGTATAAENNGRRRFQKNTLKRTAAINHWGDIRAQLEVDIQDILSLAITMQKDGNNAVASKLFDVPITSEPSLTSTAPGKQKNIQRSNAEMTKLIRRHLCVTLQKLIEHGLRTEAKTAGSLVPFIGCFTSSNNQSFTDGITVRAACKEHAAPAAGADYSEYDELYEEREDDDDGSFPFVDTDGFASEPASTGAILDHRQMHAWELILEYYHSKNGEQFNETPARKLSQSFNLELMVGGGLQSAAGNGSGHGIQTESHRQTLLGCIGQIIAMHSPYKRSMNSHFKAFVCAALNTKKLTPWLSLIFQSGELRDTFYTRWSYVACTGFRDALRSLDNLTKFNFDLPTDLAIRQFQNIKDVFM